MSSRSMEAAMTIFRLKSLQSATCKKGQKSRSPAFPTGQITKQPQKNSK